jgi:hypothetical protein
VEIGTGTGQNKSSVWESKELETVRNDKRQNEKRTIFENSMNWKPIETAPKDGTEILVSGGYFGCECSPHEFQGKFKGVALVDYDEADGAFSRWIENDDTCMYYYPTHWQPLPDPVDSGIK